MIITCPNCKKKFNIDPLLVPEDGRDLQCGSCEHVWFYKIKDEKEAPLTLNESVSKSKIELDTETKDKNLKFIKKLQQEKTIKPEIKKDISKKIPETIIESANKGSKFFSYLIVFIISLIAIVLIFDTFQEPISLLIPNIKIILNNLYETIKDIELFLKDLY